MSKTTAAGFRGSRKWLIHQSEKKRRDQVHSPVSMQGPDIYLIGFSAYLRERP
jgi:hypothetical protein